MPENKESTTEKQGPEANSIQPKKVPKLLISFFFMMIACSIAFEVVVEHANLKNEIETPKRAQIHENLPGTARFKKDFEEMLDYAECTLEHRVPRIKEMRANLTKIKCLGDVPEHLMSKWTPDQSRFDGVETYLCKKKLCGTKNENVFIEKKPTFEDVKSNQAYLKLTARHVDNSRSFLLDKGCEYTSKESKVYIKNGDLYVNHKSEVDGKTEDFTLVYYIPASDLI